MCPPQRRRVVAGAAVSGAGGVGGAGESAGAVAIGTKGPPSAADRTVPARRPHAELSSPSGCMQGVPAGWRRARQEGALGLGAASVARGWEQLRGHGPRDPWTAPSALSELRTIG